MKAETIREYYVQKLKEAEENAQRAALAGDRDNWRRIALGYQYLAGLRGTDGSEDEATRLA
jgi:hypothetical protein